ncbi:MAG: domain containing protein [Crocinitomicaceae bacterium]|jgi:PKD repeat protein|nr:domain containing protein [Crocinitomicaceae bacterium]
MKKLTAFLFLFLCSSLFAQPVAGFSLSTATACVGDTITMTSTSIPNGSPIINYVWSAQGAIVEQAEGSMTSFSFVYSNPGTYNLSLIVQDQNGLAGNFFLPNAIQVFAKPIANMVVSTLSCVGPFQLSFSNTGSSSGSTSTWSFPGGTPAVFTGDQTNVSYPNPGQPTATLRVTDNTTGCYTEVVRQLNLSSFVAGFTTPATFCKGASYQLTDASTTGANTWSWTSTGGTITSPSAQNPTITFPAAGTYTITLNTGNTLAGCSDTETKTVVVVDLPVASFTTGNTFGCAPKTVSFVNTSPSLPGAAYTWDFDDGTTFNGSGPPPHLYTRNNRMFFPALTITAPNGCVNTFVGDTVYFFPPDALFSFNNALGCAPMSVQFNDQSYSPEPIVSWSWDFDDGTTSDLQNPNHVFECGAYNVRLAIETQSGCRDTTYLSGSSINEIGPDSWSIHPDSVSIITLGDTAISRRYIEDGGVNFLYATIRYGDEFIPDFTFDPPVLCANEPLTLVCTTPPPCPPDDDIRYIWTFEGFGTQTTTDPQVVKLFFDTLKVPSPMDLGLQVNFRGCQTDMTQKFNQVYLKGPVARFDINSYFCNQGPGPHSVDITDLNSVYGHSGYGLMGGDTIVVDQAHDDVEVTYNWGDGTSDTITDDSQLEDADKGATSHVFQGYGTYQIMQTITNHTTGCADSNMRSVFITYMDGTILSDTVCNNTPYKVQVTGLAPPDHYSVNYNVSNGSQTFSANAAASVSIPNSIQNFIQNTAGITNLTLIATNSAGCSDTVIQPLRVLALPEAVISVTDDTICKNSTVEFWAGNSIPGDFPTLTSVRWTVANQPSFHSPGDTLSHFVENQLALQLQVTDGFGCISQNQEVLTIVTQGPSASFSHDPYLCNDVTALLDASESIGNNISYEWFQDGVSIPGSNTDSLSRAIHVTPEDLLFQNYMYKLVVTDNKNCTDTIEKTVYVSNPRITGIQTEIDAKYVDVNGNYTCPPVVVDFALSYQTSFEADDYKWSFANDFDTDFDSYNENPLGIQYMQAGSYNLYVEMEESVTGCIFSYSETPFLTIGGPEAEIIITTDTTSSCGMSYLFQLVNPSENLHRWSWSLGDGTVVTSEQEPDNTFSHTYLDVNDFEPVILLYDDSSQCSIPVTMNIDSFENGLEAFFEIVPAGPVVDLDMVFNDLSGSTNGVHTIVSWTWDFGDGDSLIVNNNNSVNHVYLEDTAQYVTLTIRDQYGCTDQYSLPIDIFKVNFALPNIITAAGANGANSTFSLFEDIFADFELIIINRWGNVVYEGRRDPSNPLYLWDGRNPKSGETCSDGVYFYVLQGLLVNGKTVKHQDFLTLAGGK